MIASSIREAANGDARPAIPCKAFPVKRSVNRASMVESAEDSLAVQMIKGCLHDLSEMLSLELIELTPVLLSPLQWQRGTEDEVEVESV